MVGEGDLKREVVSTATIRIGSSADLPFLREMLFEAAFWRPGAERPALAEGLESPELAKLLAGWGRPGDTAMIAESSGHERLGAAWYRFWSDEDHSHGYVGPAVPELAIGVRAEARRRGVGAALLLALLAHGGAQGVEEISLSVELDNPALRLYERLRFRRVGRVGGAWTLVARTPEGGWRR